ncbi:hypothetical protein OG693_04090 [Streptomyces sp. NBC_01259]
MGASDPDAAVADSAKVRLDRLTTAAEAACLAGQGTSPSQTHGPLGQLMVGAYEARPPGPYTL